MGTLVLDLYTKGYPEITNRIRASVFLETSPLAAIASIIDATAGHPARFYHFPGLFRNNYKVSLDEIDGGGTVLANIALFDVVPGQLETVLCRPDEQLQVGALNSGLEAGDSNTLFNGVDNRPYYLGWDIVPSELNGRGIMIEGVDYSWDSEHGIFQLLIPDDKFQDLQWYNIHFNCQGQPAGNSYPTLRDFSIELITEDTVLTSDSWGKKLIIEPSSPYIEITCPDIATVVEGRPLMVEIGGINVVTVKFILGANLNWLRGSLYGMAGESFSVYKYSRAGVPEWRISEADGHFRNVGQQVDEDMIQVDVINKQLMDGSSKDKYQYARIYNEVVLNLPLTQVVAYADWATGNNKYLYSLADIATQEFHFPDRRGLFERNNNVGKSGDYQLEAIKILPDVKGVKIVPGLTTAGVIDNWEFGSNEFSVVQSYDIVTPGATETRPVNVSKNKYVLI